MELFDTHCHIHESDVVGQGQGEDETRRRWAKLGHPAPSQLIAEAAKADVTRLLLVGCTVEDSERAVTVAAQHEKTWTSVGVHPHAAEEFVADTAAQQRFAALVTQPKVVAIGECGLDFFYDHASRAAQEQALRFQLTLAQQHGLPLVFHVREAFDDFWPIFDEYKGLRGVIHSFTATQRELDEILRRGLYVGLNGIMTFTKNSAQLAAARAVPLDHLLLETDAPYLTPEPVRATICTPKHVRLTADFLSNLRGETVELLASSTTANARKLFALG